MGPWLVHRLPRPQTVPLGTCRVRAGTSAGEFWQVGLSGQRASIFVIFGRLLRPPLWSRTACAVARPPRAPGAHTAHRSFNLRFCCGMEHRSVLPGAVRFSCSASSLCTSPAHLSKHRVVALIVFLNFWELFTCEGTISSLRLELQKFTPTLCSFDLANVWCMIKALKKFWW